MLDPELRASIIDLGMVHDVRVEPTGDVMVKVALTTAACPFRGQIGNDVRSKVAGLPGVGEVSVEYDEMTQEERSALMQKARLRASQSAPPTEVPATTRVIAVGSGKGGVGKSSITANLAAALAARASRSACSTPTSGASRSRGCSACRAGSPVRKRRRQGQDRAQRGAGRRRACCASCRWDCSSTTRTPR